jgi:hypothetical protein
MTQEQLIVLEADAPPRNGRWVDPCDVLANPTPEELNNGQWDGRTIDPDDDEQGGAPLGLLTASSDQGSALDKARDLKAIMLDFGVPQVSIELQPGRPNSFGVWDALFVVDEMSHHTVSRFGSNLTPVLSLCKRGRSDLPGPLCNGYGGWDLTYRILTFGYGNHPGAGGPPSRVDASRSRATQPAATHGARNGRVACRRRTGIACSATRATARR